MLIHLDFGNNVFAQILSSFAVPRTRMPALELHGTGGTVSISVRRSGTTPTARSISSSGTSRRSESRTGRPSRRPWPSPHGNLIGAGVPALHRLPARRGGADPDRGARLPRPRHHARGRQGSGLRRIHLARNHLLGHETPSAAPRSRNRNNRQGEGTNEPRPDLPAALHRPHQSHDSTSSARSGRSPRWDIRPSSSPVSTATPRPRSGPR